MHHEPWTEFFFPVPEAEQDDLVSLLALMDFEGFEHTGTGLKAFVPSSVITPDWLADLPQAPASRVEHTPQNWNALWEAGYDSVRIDDFCLIRPSFRPAEPGFRHTIEVQPEMAFGTGHHATTRNMVRLMAGLELTGKTVLDMGCGTGVLGLLAGQMGARRVVWIDNDPQAIQVTESNLQRNPLTGTETQIRLGGAEILPATPTFACILANINRNVLLADGVAYRQALQPGGDLLLSGFLEQDRSSVGEYFVSLGFEIRQTLQTDGWLAQHLTRTI